MNQNSSTNNENLRELKKSLGLALVFVGMQFNTALKNVIIGIDMSAIIMILSACLLMDTKRFLRIVMSWKMCVLTLFEVILLILAIMSKYSTTQLIEFQLYLLVLTYVLATNKEYIKFRYFGRIFFWLTGFISVVVLYQATRGFTRIDFEFANSGKLWMSEGGDPITMSRALEMTLIACLFYREKNPIEKVISFVYVVSAFVGMFSFSNRSTIVCSVVVVSILFFKEMKRKNNKINLIVCIMIVIAAILLLMRENTFLNKIEMLYKSVISGIGTLFNIGTVTIDSSAQMRVTILNEMKKEFSTNFLRNLFMGLGYNYRYVDRPIYQAFFDLGVLGFSVYVYFLLFVPIRVIVKCLKDNFVYNDAWIFIVYASIQCIVDQFVTGLPYYYFIWTPTVFFLFSMTNYNNTLPRNHGTLVTDPNVVKPAST